MKTPPRGIMLQLQVMVPLVAFGLQWFGLRRTWWVLNRFRFSPGPPCHPEPQIQHTLASLNKVVARTPWNGNCLSQSLVLWWQLARQGMVCQLRIGVHKRDGFQAHAWVEYEGAPIGEGNEIYQHYQVIEQFSLR